VWYWWAVVFDLRYAVAVRERLEEKFGPGALEHTAAAASAYPKHEAGARPRARPRRRAAARDERILLGMLTVPDSLAAQILGKLGVAQHAAEAIVTRRDE
jgi:Clp amino terminal domain, pathogenicity island component